MNPDGPVTSRVSSASPRLVRKSVRLALPSAAMDATFVVTVAWTETSGTVANRDNESVMASSFSLSTTNVISTSSLAPVRRKVMFTSPLSPDERVRVCGEMPTSKPAAPANVMANVSGSFPSLMTVAVNTESAPLATGSESPATNTRTSAR